MATANELLSGMSMLDRTLVVDNNFRTIKIPATVPTIGVENDDDVHRLEFRLPRYVSGTDLSEFSIRINYINAQGESDVYTVRDSDKETDSQYISFTWLVGPTATRYKGNTKFNICCQILSTTEKDEDGLFLVDREFNTTVATLPVLEGLEVDEGIVSQYSDIITQWQNELFGTTDSEIEKIKAASIEQQNAINQKGNDVKNSIPDEYETVVNLVHDTARTKADAIVCTIDGESIVAPDSSDDTLRGLSVFAKSSQITTTGKNLFDQDSCTWVRRMIVKTGSISGSDSTSFLCTENYVDVSSLQGKTVTLNHTAYENGGAGNASTAFYGSDKSFIDYAQTGTFTIPGNAHYMRITIPNTYIVPDTNPIAVSSIQIEMGEASTDYEPYTGGKPSPNPAYPQEIVGVENPTVKVYSKNLLKIVAATKEVSGVMVTVNPDGSVKFKGTAAEAVFFGLNFDIRTMMP